MLFIIRVSVTIRYLKELTEVSAGLASYKNAELYQIISRYDVLH